MLPAPQPVAPRRDMTAVRNRIRDAILYEYEACGYGEQGYSPEEGIERGLSGYSDSVLDAYDKALREQPHAGFDRDGFQQILVKAIVHGHSSGEAGYLLFISKQIKELDMHSYDYALRLYAGLDSVDRVSPLEIPENILEPEDEQAAAVIAALLTVTNAVHAMDGEWGMMLTRNRNGVFGEKLSNDDLIDLIVDKPEHAERISNIIYERETTDVNLIRFVIESESSSMSEGVL